MYLYEPSKRKPIECVFCLSSLKEKKRARRIPEPKLVNTHPRELRGDKMPELMHHDKSNDDDDEYEDAHYCY
jgi:hypothetical protein